MVNVYGLRVGVVVVVVVVVVVAGFIPTLSYYFERRSW